MKLINKNIMNDDEYMKIKVNGIIKPLMKEIKEKMPEDPVYIISFDHFRLILCLDGFINIRILILIQMQKEWNYKD